MDRFFNDRQQVRILSFIVRSFILSMKIARPNNRHSVDTDYGTGCGVCVNMQSILRCYILDGEAVRNEWLFIFVSAVLCFTRPCRSGIRLRTERDPSTNGPPAICADHGWHGRYGVRGRSNSWYCPQRDNNAENTYQRGRKAKNTWRTHCKTRDLTSDERPSFLQDVN